MAAMEMAFAHSASAGRAFCLGADEIESLDRIAGIKARDFRPSIFVIDDAQDAFDNIERLVDRLSSLEGATLMLTARMPPPGMDMLDPVATDFVADLRDRGQFIAIAVDAPRVRALVAKSRRIGSIRRSTG